MKKMTQVMISSLILGAFMTVTPYMAQAEVIKYKDGDAPQINAAYTLVSDVAPSNSAIKISKVASPPVIGGISQSIASEGVQVTLNGLDLDGVTANTIFIVATDSKGAVTGLINPQITSQTSTQLTFVVPNIPAATYDVSVFSTKVGGESNKVQLTVVYPARITSTYPNPFRKGDQMVIEGSRFDGANSENRIYITDVAARSTTGAKIISFSPTKIVIEIPDIPYTNYTINVLGDTGDSNLVPFTVVAPTTTPTDPGTPNNPGGGNPSDSNPSSRSGQRRSGGSSGVIVSTLPLLSNISSCSYLNSYMKMGSENNTAEVIKLQTILKNVEGANIDINGTFDQKTLDAVNAFQAKYVNEIMAPWGVTAPTGYVYITTQKKINELYCKAIYSLTAEQLKEIEAYRTGLQNGTFEVGNPSDLNIGTTSTSTDIGSNAGNSQTASVGSSIDSFFGKIWGFIKWLFGYNR